MVEIFGQAHRAFLVGDLVENFSSQVLAVLRLDVVGLRHEPADVEELDQACDGRTLTPVPLFQVSDLFTFRVPFVAFAVITNPGEVLASLKSDIIFNNSISLLDLQNRLRF